MDRGRASGEITCLEDLLDDLKHSARGDTVSAGEIIDAFQDRSLGVLMALVGLVTVVPLVGDIPGVPSAAATLVLVAIVQAIRGRGGLWLPDFLRRRRMRRDRLERGIEKARPWVRRVDRVLKQRLCIVSKGRPQRLAISAAGGVLALSLYPMEFVPFGANAPGAALIALGLGRMTRDGVLVLIGFALTAVTVYVLVTAASHLPI